MFRLYQLCVLVFLILSVTIHARPMDPAESDTSSVASAESEKGFGKLSDIFKKKDTELTQEQKEFKEKFEEYKKLKAEYKELETAYSKAKADYQQHFVDVKKLKDSKKRFLSNRNNAINSLSSAEIMIQQIDQKIAEINAKAETELKPAVESARKDLEEKRQVIKPLEEKLNKAVKKHSNFIEKAKYYATGKTKKAAQTNFGKTFATRLRAAF